MAKPSNSRKHYKAGGDHVILSSISLPTRGEENFQALIAMGEGSCYSFA